MDLITITFFINIRQILRQCDLGREEMYQDFLRADYSKFQKKEPDPCILKSLVELLPEKCKRKRCHTNHPPRTNK